MKTLLNKQEYLYLLTQEGVYESIFALFLCRIEDINWFEYFARQLHFIQANTIVTYGVGTSHYYNGKMTINHNQALLDNMVILHEYGHFIFDDKVSEESIIITDLFKKETLSLVNDEEYLVKLYRKFGHSINWHHFCYNRRYCPIMLTDGISIIQGKKSLGISHHHDYPICNLASELFTEVLEAEVMGYKVPLAIYKKECPKTYSYIKNKIYEVLDV